MVMREQADALLDVRNLSTVLRVPGGGVVTAVDNISLCVRAGRSLALVGESGSGKSMTCLSLLRLLPDNARLAAGQVLFKGRDLARLSLPELESLRGSEIGMVLQDAMTSLNPLLTIGAQVSEVFRIHQGIRDRRELRRLASSALEQVGIPAAAERLDSYPFQFSGGMRQRVSIAINMALTPALLICDEPTSGLDVTVQRQILGLLRALQAKYRTAILLVTHDLHLAAQFCDDVAIMYAGRIVESGPVAQVFRQPVHPYTRGLLAAIPALEHCGALQAIPGQQPTLDRLPPGCRFAPRCAHSLESCLRQYPDWFEWDEGRRRVACWRTEDILLDRLDIHPVLEAEA
jgi:oligopeptide/dipeptide ABC transporter ATP-binding protein